MAGRGRGFSLKSFKIKDKEESDTQSVTSTSSTALLLQGRGRGLAAFPPKAKPWETRAVPEKPHPNQFRNDSDEEKVPGSRPSSAKIPSVASGSEFSDQKSEIVSGSVLTSFTLGRGRGFFANPMKPTSNKPVPSPVSSQTKSKEPLSSSGIDKGQTTPCDTSQKASQATSSGAQKNIGQTSDDVSTGTGRVPVLKHGKTGQLITACTNAIPLHCDPESGVFEYEVRFTPFVDSMKFRGRYLMQHKELIGNAKTFDGVVLFLPHKLPEDITHLVSKSQDEESEINVQIIFKRRKRLGDSLQLYNILFDKVYKVLNYLRVNRKFYDPTAPQLLPSKRLEVWPGYVKAVDELEGGLMLTLDVSHRVLATRTVLENMTECYQSDRERFQENIKRDLIGKIVLTRYNNKTYRVDDITFEQTPKDTFMQGDKEISYAEYYKQQYNIEIKDMNQRLLISRKELRISGEREKKEFLFCLIPELCYLTGLSDAMKKNFTVLKELATYTKLSPYVRLGAYKKFLENVENTPNAKEILSDWGLSLDKDPIKVTARVLDEEKIIFGHGKTGGAGDRADFSKHATNNEVLEVVDFHDWLLVYTIKDRSTADCFESTMMKVCGPTGIRVAKSRRIELENDRTETFVNKTREALKGGNTQIVVIIFPSARDDRYAAIKRTLCVDVPVPSQVINARTLKNEAKNRSVVQKIILQMNCKLGGTLWGVKIPLKETMICGIDTFHEAGLKGMTVAGFVATYNPEFTKWFSRPTIQEKREELVNGLVASMESAIAKYYDYNKNYPQSIVIYRDGVSDGQLEFVKTYEIQQFKAAFKRVKEDYRPKLTFIVVKKRIDMKYFRYLEGKPTGSAYCNAPPGTVVDSIVTTKYMYDFYIVSQYIREGTSTPSHYIVLEDEKDFDPDILQRMTYKLCYLYYNWPGTVRVPAPCQYAHKLADLIGMSVKKQVSEKLADKLYFL